ncbi:MAG: RNA polymerase factor sigma-32, partial [Acidobacteriota bacterium]
LQDRELSHYLREVDRFVLLTREEELALALRYRDHGEIEAAHRLVVANLRFVVRIALEYRGYGMKLLDLVQEGNAGLMRAVKRFDPRRGYRLITYAVWWIRAEIQAYVVRSWSQVKIGAGHVARRLFFGLRGARARAEQEIQGEVGAGELAARLGVSEAELSDMEVRLAARDYSLDAPMGEEGTTFVDQLADPAPLDPETLAAHREQKRLLATALDDTRAELNAKERFVLDHRLLCADPPTLAEVGADLGLTRQRVQQIESGLIEKLRRALPAPTAVQAS